MIKENLQLIQQKIADSAANSGRSPVEIKLVAVSKRFPVEKITEAFGAGQTIFGENYIQEVQTKKDLVPEGVMFHFIGHLQSNKAKIAAESCAMIETIDRIKLGRILNNHLETINKNIDVLIQVNIGQDPKKAGADDTATEELLLQLNQLPRLRVCGLMTMPPLSVDPEDSRPHFRNLRKLSERLLSKGLFTAVKKPELSMGMSDDFHIAIEEGATIVRVGTAIFGRRA
ncbi:MAG: YggS family pyridoxal phosphate-dependent enzyme [Desulforhopalus sp.]